ncbi:MAG: DNA repair ATPase [Deltaproteobacteria bacterium]|nr:DNA repair ATPase [Deltaproteobacteria bacterium]
MPEASATTETPGGTESAGGSPAEGGPGGSYEVIRQRLSGQGRGLADAARALNEQRQALFGGTEAGVLGTERVRTENNCVPVDIVQVGGLLLFGYNVFVGLRKTTTIDDVFSVQHFSVREDGLLEFTPASPEEAAFLHGAEFQRAFTQLYQYYSDTRLVALRSDGRKLLAVFQTGESEDSVKVFQWGLDASEHIEYIDDRGERAFVPPPTHDFEWTETSRDDHILGRHPHVSVEDVVFVETVGGDLTIKVEDNTEDGLGVYREDVDDPNQSLDDAHILYTIRGSLVLLRIRPYMEDRYRHLVFNRRTQHVLRIDSVGDSCVALPEDHGVIFPGGYVLQTGEYKVFPDVDEDLRFLRKVASPNGEDVLFVFNRRRDGLYVLFPYNLIRREVRNPIRCHGWSLFDDGRLVVFRAASDEPSRVHPMQVWDTPFVSAEHAAQVPTDGSALARIGNKELVRGLSDCLTVGRMVVEQEPSRGVYEALVTACQRALDTYFWFSEDEIALASPLAKVRDVAELIIDEFEKVQILQREAQSALTEAREQQRTLKDDLHPDSWVEAEQFMAALTGLRTQRGHLITMRDVRYIDRAAIDGMEEEVAGEFERISRATVEFLLGDDALTPLTKRIEELHGQIEAVERLVDMKPLVEKQGELISGLELMTEVVSGLEIDDATARAAILERLGEVFGQVNRVRAVLTNKRKEIAGHEARADFAAQWSLLGQSVSSAVALADSPEACDDQLSRLMLQLEELEARFGEFDEFLPQLASKREEIELALGARKQVLVDERQKRIGSLVKAAERILSGVARRARTFKDQDELNAWFASDSMVLKLRDLGDKLTSLGDAVKGEELLARLQAARQDALRGLRDRLELFDGDGANLIKFGKHRFPVNTRPLELTMVPRDGAMALHLTGTDFYEVIEDPKVAAAQPFWEQALPSEGADVSRAEFLAASILFAAEAGQSGLTVSDLEDAVLEEQELMTLVREYAAERYDEGYERGVHDADAATLLRELLHLRGTAGLLRFPPRPRAAAMLFWAWSSDSDAKERWHRRARSFGRLRETLGATGGLADLAHELAGALGTMLAEAAPSLTLAASEAAMAGSYLVEELQAEHPRFCVSSEAQTLHDALVRHLEDHGGRRILEDDLAALDGLFEERLALVRAWTAAVFGRTAEDAQTRSGAEGEGLALETAARLLTESILEHEGSAALTSVTATGLLSQHRRIRDGVLELRLDEYLGRLSGWIGETVPAFAAWRTTRHAVLERERRRLRLDEYTPRVMSAFVRNKLINDVYLPIVGDNLAKQMGSAGDSRRTDQMGLLLLVSPPGYGKTTLMEYIASRLGLVFMKVNGPALGHDVTSLDPAEAPNATARQEVEKINLAFEMANNVMLYLDDIQHTHPELLQKFISLCDGTRRIEGVWKGRTRTYDLRGKKFAVVMAGNPYTESGDRFQIPDMLANRADTYNLGDILDGREEAFALSYVENSLTSNPVLQPLATREQSDVYKLVNLARGEEVPTSDLSHEYSTVELNEVTGVLRKLARVQEVVLAVNQQYISSAAQEDAFRTEPPFKLQGSYRNMNKLSEKIVPAMNDAELDALLRDHYIGEAQTLTTGAEANLLKLWEMLGTLTDEQRARWEDIRKEFRRSMLTGGGEDDPVARVTGALSGLDRQLEAIRETLVAGSTGDLEESLEEIGVRLGTLTEQVQRGANAIGHTAKAAVKSSEMQEALVAATEAAASASAAAAAKAPTVAGQGDLAMKLDVIVGELASELQGIRKGVQGTARGLADLNVLEFLAASPDAIRSNEDVAEVQREVLLQAQNALAGNLREIDPDDMTMRSPRSAVLAGSLPVIQDLFVKIGQLLGTVSLSQEEWASLMDQLRRHVAEAVTDLAQE